MSIDHAPASAEIPRDDPNQKARAFGFRNFAEFATASPRFGSVLIVGNETEDLAEELAIIRYDIEVTSVGSYTDDTQPQIDTPLGNAAFIAYDIDSLDDIFPADHFDRIYYAAGTDDDQKLPSTLQELLKSDGILRMRSSDPREEPIIVAKNGQIGPRKVLELPPYQKKSFLLEDLRDASIIGLAAVGIASLLLKRRR